MNPIQTILQSVNQIPPFPAVLQRVLVLVEDPKSSAQDVVEVIQYDQAITANVLKVCNSAYFNLRRPVHSIREALVRIGFNRLIEIVLTRGSTYLFCRACQGYELEEGELWRHSAACALLPGLVSDRMKKEKSPAQFTGALLHDIGKVILSRFVQESFKEIQAAIREKKLSFAEAERDVLGIDHAELGGRISEAWKFPSDIVSAIRYHHTPFLAPEHQDMVSLVYLCNVIARLAGYRGGGEGLSPAACREIMNQYGLGGKDLQEISGGLNEGLKQIDHILRIK